MNISEKALYYRGLKTIKKALGKAQDDGLLFKGQPYGVEEGLFEFHPYNPTKPITVSINKKTINNPTLLLLGEPCGKLHICWEGKETIFSPKTISQIAIGLLVYNTPKV